MIEELLWLALGWLLGIIAGLLPGIHTNTISFLLLGVAARGEPGWIYAILGMNVVQSFFDFLPNVFLGLPDEESFVNLMPAHRLLAKGRGVHAVRLGVMGTLAGIPLALLLFPLFTAFVLQTREFLEKIIPFALALVLASMVLGEKGMRKKGLAFLVVALAGGFGLLSLPGAAATEPLFPAITGLFGLPALIQSAKAGNRVPPQHDCQGRLKPKNLLEGTVLGAVAAGLVALLPAVGPGEASFILLKLLRKTSASLYLIVVGCINACNLLFSFLFLYVMGKTRSGAAVALQQLQATGTVGLVTLAGACLVSAAFGAVASVWTAKQAARKIGGLDYQGLTQGVIFFLAGVVFLAQGPAGLLLLGIGTAIGLLPYSFGVRRAHAMAYLMVPTLAYYFPFPA